MNVRNRRAFTLVELLVVIGIIGMLIALLLPAVLSAQEQARQTQCQKQMKDMASAVLQFTLKKNRFPGYAETWTVSDGAGGTLSYDVGWLPQLFAYLDMQERLRDLREGTDIDGVAGPDFLDHIPFVTCPSDPPDLEAPFWSEAASPDGCGASTPSPAPAIAFPTSYAVAAGKPDNGAADSKLDAVFHDRRAAAAKVTIGLDDIQDGKRQTLILAENVDLANWNSIDENHQAVVFDDVNGTVNFNEGLIAPYDCDNDGLADNLDSSHARPSSFHHEGFNVAYADGSVELFFIDQTMLGNTSDPNHPYLIYKRKMTPNRRD